MSKKIEVRDSPTHWKWIFAVKNISSWEIILKWDISHQVEEDKLKTLSAAEKKYICNLGNKHIYMQEPERYINHSCNPNTKIWEFCDIAIRDIHAWEEITGNYNEVTSEWPEIECNCWSKNCIWKIFN